MLREPSGVKLVFDKGKDNETMKRSAFKILASINRLLLPRMSKKELTKLTKFQKAIVAWRYWVTINALG